MTFRLIKHTFHGGELSPDLRGRGDAPVYLSGLERARNVLCSSVGDVRLRPGTRFMEQISHSPPPSGKAVAIPFLDTDDDLIIVLTEGKADAYRESDLVGTAFQGQVGAGWTAAQLRDVRYAQAFDTMILTHPDLPQQKFLRTGTSTYVLDTCEFASESTVAPGGISRLIPYAKLHPFGVSAQAQDPLSLGSPHPSPDAGDTTYVVLSGDHFTADHLGATVRLRGKRIVLTNIQTPARAVGLIVDTLVNSAATTDWDEQAWGDYAGFPRHCLFFGQRLVFAGTPTLPDGVWMSKVGDYFNFDLGDGEDDDAIWTVLGVDGIAEIRGLIGLSDLLFLTDAGAVTTDGNLTPASLGFRRQHSVGSARIMPQEIDGAVVYVSQTGSVNEMMFSDNIQGYESDPISTLASHLFASTTTVRTAASYAAFGVPDRHVFLIQSDGTMIVGHSNRAEKVLGWQLWTVADGSFLDVISVRNRVFALVTLTHQSGKTYLVEFDPDYVLDVAVKHAGPISSLIWTGAASGTIDVLAGGAWQQTVVADGSGLISFTSGSNIEAGYDFAWQAKSLPIDVLGPQILRTQRWQRVVRAIPFLSGTWRFALVYAGVTNQVALSAATTGPTEYRLLGYRREGQVEFTQGTHPGAFAMTALELELSA